MARKTNKVKRPLCPEAMLICHVAHLAYWQRQAVLAARKKVELSPLTCQLAGVTEALAKATPESLAKTYRPADAQDLFCELLTGQQIDCLVQLGNWPPTKQMVAIVTKPPKTKIKQKQDEMVMASLGRFVAANPELWKRLVAAGQAGNP